MFDPPGFVCANESPVTVVMLVAALAARGARLGCRGWELGCWSVGTALPLAWLHQSPAGAVAVPSPSRRWEKDNISAADPPKAT